MNYKYLQQIFGNQNEPLPAIKLLRSNYASLIISFLYQEFKINNNITISNYDLVNKLANYLEEIDFNEETNLNLLGDNIKIAKKYIDDWSNFEYIRKYPDETGEPLHELTSYTEKIIKWLENLKPKEFIGTESRLKDIINRLKELISESTENPDEKIKELEEKKKNTIIEIDKQIRQIKQTGKVDTAFSAVQIKERFENISEDARNLLADFKEVENNFNKITKNIIEKQLNEYAAKGKLLKYMLDETEELEKSSQGKSFYAFWDFLRFEKGETELDNLLFDTYKLISEKNINNNDLFLKNLKYYLLDAGKKVSSSNDKLIEKLSRTLSDKNLKERKKADELTKKIQQIALELSDSSVKDENFIELEGDAVLELISFVQLQFEPNKTINEFDSFPQINKEEEEDDIFENLFNQFEVNKKELVNNIKLILTNQQSTTLKEIIEKFPLKKGIAELLTYFAIASENEKYIIETNNKETVIVSEAKNEKMLIPRIIYTK